MAPTPKPPAPQASLASRAARDPELLKRVMANPNLRYKLPTSMLSVAQKRARQKAQATKEAGAATAAISDPTTPLHGVDLTSIAQQLVNGAYDPQTKELDRQGTQAIALGKQTSQRTGGIYDTIAKYQTAALTAQNSQQQAGASATAGLTTAALGQVDAASAQQRAQAAKDAEVRGTGLDGGGMEALAARSLAAKDSIAARGQIAGDSLAANAQTNNAVLGGIGASTQQHRGEVQDNIAAGTKGTLDKLAAARLGVTAEKGSKLTDTLLKLRQQSTDEYYTAAGLNLKNKLAGDDAAASAAAAKTKRNQDLKDDKTKRGQTVEDREAKAKADAKKWGRTLNKYGISNAAWYQWGKTEEGKKKRQSAMDASRKGGKGSKADDQFLPAEKQTEAKNEIARALDLIKQFKAKGTAPSLIRSALLRGQAADKKAGKDALKPVDAIWLNVAMDLAYLNGTISRANVEALHGAKIKVGQLGYKFAKPGSQIAGSGSGSAGGTSTNAGDAG